MDKRERQRIRDEEDPERIAESAARFEAQDGRSWGEIFHEVAARSTSAGSSSRD
jgi:hypothetical protein